MESLAGDPTPSEEPSPTLTERLFNAALGTFDVAGVYLGDRLGLYRVLADEGPASPAELAKRAQIDARYAREWLEQQAVTGILDVESTLPDGERRYMLPDHNRSALVEPESLDGIAPLARMLTAALGRLPEVADAFRSGDGVGWERYGVDMREGQARFNRPACHHLLGREWLPAVPEIDRRLREPGATIVDVACGEGWSTMAIARAYPAARVIGIDLDGPSIEAARRHSSAEEGVGNVEFRHGDASELTELVDAAVIIEAVHDMSDPVAVLRAVRGNLGPRRFTPRRR